MSDATQSTTPPAGTTQMTNPPKTQTTTQGPAAKGPRMIKLVCLREFRIEDYVYGPDGKTVVEDRSRMAKPGEIVSLPEPRAREMIAPIKGAYAFGGERFTADSDCKRHDLTRARLATKRDLVEKAEEPLTPLEDAS